MLDPTVVAQYDITEKAIRINRTATEQENGRVKQQILQTERHDECKVTVSINVGEYVHTKSAKLKKKSSIFLLCFDPPSTPSCCFSPPETGSSLSSCFSFVELLTVLCA